MATGLINIMKQAAVEAVDQGKPVNLCFGTVNAVDPLIIQITPNLIIYEEYGQIKVCRECTDYETSITLLPPEKEGEVEWRTELKGGGSGEQAYEEHYHEIKNKHHVMIHNKLEVGDYVILGRMQGGQQYIVFDKVGET